MPVAESLTDRHLLCVSALSSLLLISPLLSSPSLSPQPSLVSPAVRKLYWMPAEPLRGDTLNASAIILLIMASHTYTHGDTRAARG